MDPEAFTQDWGTYGEENSANIFEMSTNDDAKPMLRHIDLSGKSSVEIRENQSVNGPLAF